MTDRREPTERRRTEAFSRVARTHSGVKSFDLWACHVCGALVDPQCSDRHLDWHRRTGTE